MKEVALWWPLLLGWAWQHYFGFLVPVHFVSLYMYHFDAYKGLFWCMPMLLLTLTSNRSSQHRSCSVLLLSISQLDWRVLAKSPQLVNLDFGPDALWTINACMNYWAFSTWHLHPASRSAKSYMSYLILSHTPHSKQVWHRDSCQSWKRLVFVNYTINIHIVEENHQQAIMASISFRKFIRWLPDEASEPTSTLVLTSPEKRFVDIRVVLPDGKDSLANNEGKDKPRDPYHVL